MNFALSKTALDCYETLFNNGGESATQLAEQLQRPRTGLYRVLKRLETVGLVTSVPGTSQPTYFYAEPLKKALANYADYQHRLTRELIIKQNEILMKLRGPHP